MTTGFVIERAGPAMSVQDLGRPGFLHIGVPQGGAADRLAVCENAALLGQGADCAVVEMAGMGGQFRAVGQFQFALTGAPMRAAIDGTVAAWNTVHTIADGQVLTVGPAVNGVYGYLGVRGGFQTDVALNSRAAHVTCGIGAWLQAGAILPVGGGADVATCALLPADRFSGGVVRFIDGPQTELFDPSVLARFCDTVFTRAAAGNRQGVRFDAYGDGFAVQRQLGLLSDAITPGDIQMTGDGVPYVLLPECQTIGGYPRIGTVIPQDIPIVAQAAVGAQIQFQRVDRSDAIADFKTAADLVKELKSRTAPVFRDPAQMSDLLSYQLISGMITGWEDA